MRNTTYEIRYTDNHNVATTGHRTSFRTMYNDAKYMSKANGGRVVADYWAQHGTVTVHIIYTFLNGKLYCKDAFGYTIHHEDMHTHIKRA